MKGAKKYFVTAIGTDIGKTIVSAVLVNALKADYWKPIQCGNLDSTDSDFIRKNTDAKVHPEKFRFSLPASPHQASADEKVVVYADDFILPDTSSPLIVEGAGGMMVPLNEKNELVMDIAKELDLDLILVASFYLGSINHTLLSLEYAYKTGMKISQLIFTGGINESSLDIIRKFHPQLKIGFVPEMKQITRESLAEISSEYAKKYLHDLE